MNGFFQFDRTEQLWWFTVAVLLTLTVTTLGLQFVDKRLIDGASVWAKPTKFGVSLAIHFATLALVVRFLGETSRTGPLLWWIAIFSVGATVFEMGYILLQASRAEASHFNVGTPMRVALYAGMAAGAVIITVAAGGVGWAALVDPGPRLGFAVRAGVAIGLIGGTLLTLIVAFRLGGALSHHVGVELPGAPRMPLTGWSLSVGDRRVPHFFATHMMQAVPSAALILEMLASRWLAMAGTLAFACAWAAFTWALFAQANAGYPIFRA